MYIVMLGNGSGTDFQDSQCIPMVMVMLLQPLTLPRGVFIPFDGKAPTYQKLLYHDAHHGDSSNGTIKSSDIELYDKAMANRYFNFLALC